MNQTRKRNSGRPPISAHPAFPAIVALWFAALFGLGSLVLPVHVLESIVTAAGLPSIFSAAAPPLGFTARAAIALAATICGAAIGFVAARRLVGGPHRAPTERLDDDNFPLLDDSEELVSSDRDDDEEDYREDGFLLSDPETIDGAETQKIVPFGRRRPLSVTDESGPSELLANAPRQKVAPFIEDEEIENDIEALELDECDELPEGDADVPVQRVPESEPVSESFLARPFELAEKKAAATTQIEPLPFSPPSLSREPVDPEIPASGVSQEWDSEAEDTIDPSIDSHQIEVSVTDTTSDKQVFNSTETEAFFDTTGDEIAGEIPEPFEPEIGIEQEEIAENEPVEVESDNESPGLVQLVQKLGSALEKHREWSAQRPPSPAAQPSRPVPQEFEAAAPDEAASATAAYFGKPEATPAEANEAPQSFEIPKQDVGSYATFSDAAALLGDDTEVEDDYAELEEIASSFSLPLMERETAWHVTPRPSIDLAPAASDAPAPATIKRDAGYDALSGVENPFKRQDEQFVRIDEPEPDLDVAQPSVQFPNEVNRLISDVRAETVDDAPARPFDAPATPAPRPASNDDNERALREALMNLQRMGK